MKKYFKHKRICGTIIEMLFSILDIHTLCVVELFFGCAQVNVFTTEILLVGWHI
jgi:hypothetical protein